MRSTTSAMPFLNVSTVVPCLLELFDKYEIHATWATVGGIMAAGKKEWLRYAPETQPLYHNEQQCAYRLTDAIDTAAYPAEIFFRKELVSQIHDTPHQEIGSHTFSHFYCNEIGATQEAFSADLDAFEKIAADSGFPPASSAVFPKNQINKEYLPILEAHGYKTYRGFEDNWIHNKIKSNQVVRALRLLNNYLPLTGSDAFTVGEPEHGVYNIKASRFFRPHSRGLSFLDPLKLRRIKGQMRQAARQNKIYHLWWHPHNFGLDLDANLRELETLFIYYKKLNGQYNFQSATMSEAANAAASGGKETRDNVTQAAGTMSAGPMLNT